MTSRISEDDLYAFMSFRTRRGDPLSLDTYQQLLGRLERPWYVSLLRPWLHITMGFAGIFVGGVMLPSLYGWAVFLTGGALVFLAAQDIDH